MTTEHTTGLTQAQMKIWTGQELNPGTPLYNMAVSCHINGKLDLTAAKVAWQCVIRKHDTLSVYLDDENRTAQLVPTDVACELHQTDLSSLGASAVVRAHKLIKEETLRCFNKNESLTHCWLITLNNNNHIWYLKQHHVITDALSMSVIWNEFNSTYNVLAIDNAADKSIESSITEDSALIKRIKTDYYKEQLEIPNDSELLSYWDKQNGDPAPLIFSKKTLLTDTGSTRRTLSFTDNLSKALNHLYTLPNARSIIPHAGQCTVLLSLLFALLHRLTGQSALCVALPAANRGKPEYVTDTGLYIELLPLSISVNEDDTFNDLLLKVRTAFIDNLKNTFPGASRIAPSDNAIAVFNFITATFKNDNFDGLDVEWHDNQHIDAHHALRLQATDWLGEGDFSIAIDFKNVVFSAKQQSEAEEAWWNLTEGFAKNPEQLINSISIVSSDSKDTLHDPGEVRQDNLALSTPQLPLSAFKEQVNAFPDAIAVNTYLKDASEKLNTLSFAQLDRITDIVARQLMSASHLTNNRIGVALPRCADQLIAILGIMKSGACYVPLDFTQPTERLESICKDADPGIVITSETIVDALPTTDSIRFLLLEHLQQDLNNPAGLTDLKKIQLPEDRSKNLPVISPDNTAYILYTSGSTGTPKGVSISHGALGNYLSWAKKYYCKDERHRFCYFTPFTFDLTVTSIFLPLVSGGQLRIYPESGDNLDFSVLEVMQDRWATIVKLTPAHLALLSQEVLSSTVTRQLIIGGEDLKQAVAQRVFDLCNGQIVIHNEYGPTENTVGCIVHTFEPGARDRVLVSSVPIGKPISGVSYRVVNKLLQDQPIGVSGELLLAGKSLADGYWNNEPLTEKSFLQLIDKDGVTEMFYRSGDLVRLNDQNELVYEGRLDDQIKINGIRTDTREITSIAMTIDGIEDCVVQWIDHESALTLPESHCQYCGLSSRHPEAHLDSNNLCKICKQFLQSKEQTQSYFGTMDQLDKIVASVKSQSDGDYDCIVLLSGGKDSTYSLGILVDKGLRVLAFTLDNGYISEQAKANIRTVCNELGVDHHFGQTAYMNEIFADSLNTHSNVCHGCFKVLYTLSLKLAKDKGIRAIFTGLSRGQFFETRLDHTLFKNKHLDIKEIDSTILESRKAYHLQSDAVSRWMDVDHVQSEAIFDEIRIIDFYRYCDVQLEDIYKYLKTRLKWTRPADTGRSTNCLINDVGIYVHKMERGYHNYSLPYSWDVRLGHKTRLDALEELDDDIDTNHVHGILNEIKYIPKESHSVKPPTGLALYYTKRHDKNVEPKNILIKLRSTLPEWMLPKYFVPMQMMPIGINGKINSKELPIPKYQRLQTDTEYEEPGTDAEHLLNKIWCDVLGIDRVGIHDNYFHLKGDSIAAVRIISQIRQSGYQCNLSDIFDKPSIFELARTLKFSTKDNNSATEQTSRPFDTLSTNQLNKLSELFKD